MATNADELEELIEALKGAGFTVPDEVDSVHFLIIAIKAQGPPQKRDANDDDEEIDATGSKPAPGGPPMLMSTLGGADRVPLTKSQKKTLAYQRQLAAEYSIVKPKT